MPHLHRRIWSQLGSIGLVSNRAVESEKGNAPGSPWWLTKNSQTQQLPKQRVKLVLEEARDIKKQVPLFVPEQTALRS